jgi:hypothetical protein
MGSFFPAQASSELSAYVANMKSPLHERPSGQHTTRETKVQDSKTGESGSAVQKAFGVLRVVGFCRG